MKARRLAGWALVALGTVPVSIAVAWGCALWAPMKASRALPREEVTTILTTRLGADRFLTITSGVEHYGVGWAYLFAGDAAPPPVRARAQYPAADPPRVLARATVKPLPASPDDKYVQIVRAGWPMNCLHGAATSIRGERRRDGVMEPPRQLTRLGVKPLRLLPLYPIWGGLAVNTVFYGGVFWLAVPGPKLLRRVRRRHRGLCPGCGYDLAHHEHESCPECGA